MIDSIWRVLDDFDDLPQDDRLLAVVEETRTAFDAMRPVLIITELVKEADYIAAAAQEYWFVCVHHNDEYEPRGAGRCAG